MKKTIITLFLIVIAQLTFAQKVQYTYDNHGNRIKRKIFTIAPPEQRMAGSDSTDNAEAARIADKEGISVYPNPTKDRVVLTINDFNSSDNNSMSLIDVKGNVVMEQKVTSAHSEMDVSKLTAGIYYFNVVKNKNMLYYKLVKID
ncbi:MAG: T9SS type A sorting domain-containing protein [Bacteroidota bacterium]